MNKKYVEIVMRGKKILAPTVDIDDRTIIILGSWIRIASIHREDWMEGEPVENPEWFIPKIKELALDADIFSFSKKLPDTGIKYPFHYDWDNVAAIPISSFEDWWHERISRKTRQEVKRAERLGVKIKVVPFGEGLIRDIVDLFNRISIKQGLPFTHHGKDYAKVQKDISPYSDRSDFIGAYYEDELIGYMKIVFMGKIASILNIITDPIHFEKRPGNALLAEAIRVCEKKGLLYLLYGKYAYGNKVNSSLAEFKRRNGFEMIRFPRYYVPLNLKGRIIINTRLYRGLLGLLPESLILPLINFRSGFSMIIPLF
jgi:hypothetical protein